MTKCIFCGKEERYFKGLNLIQNDGSVSYFCSSKCRRNFLKLKRDKRKLKWTSAFHEERAKERLKAESKKALEKEKKPVKNSKE